MLRKDFADVDEENGWAFVDIRMFLFAGPGVFGYIGIGREISGDIDREGGLMDFANKVLCGCGVVLFNDKGQFLMMKRKSKHAAGTYCVPGGWIEKGEELTAAGAREVWEKVGVEIENIKILGVTNNIFPDENLHTVSVIMAAKIKSGSPRVMEPDKCETLVWCDDWDKVPQPALTVYNRYISKQQFENYRSGIMR